MRKLKFIAGTLVALTAVVFIACATISEPRPVGQVNQQADDLARTMLARIDVDAWNATRAVTWNFGGRRTHLWDRDRNYDLYRNGELTVLLRIGDKTGIVRDGGNEVTGEAATKALEGAWEAWVNDSFWLNAPSKCFDEGTQRSIVRDEHGDHLLVAYSSGGVTPGDAYLWDIGDSLPTAWKMWTQILKIGGVKATWEGWEKLSTGAWVSTKHVMTARTLELTDVRGALTLAELVPGEDPFASLER